MAWVSFLKIEIIFPFDSKKLIFVKIIFGAILYMVRVLKYTLGAYLLEIVPIFF